MKKLHDLEHPYAMFECTCGVHKKASKYDVASGKTRSCGCLRKQVAQASAITRNTTHGMARTRAYRIWAGIKDRCENQNSKYWARYGGRGIRNNWKTFEAFFADMGAPPLTSSIDRVDNDGPYSKDNCRWATSTEQNNNRRGCIYITHEGVTQTMSQWARELHVHKSTISLRIKRGKHPILGV